MMATNDNGYHLEKKWVLPGTFVKHGHCEPRSFTSYQLLNLIHTLHFTVLLANCCKPLMARLGGKMDQHLIYSLIHTFH